MSPNAAPRSAREPRERVRRRDVEFDHGVRRNADIIKRGFDEYRVAFSRITRRAKIRFEKRNWPGMLADARTRRGLYDRIVRRVIADVRSHAHVRNRDRSAWIKVKRAYAELIAGSGASGVAETFFNSVTRRAFGIVGVDSEIEFVDFAFRRIPTGLGDTPHRTYASVDGTEAQICEILTDFAFESPYRDMIGDARRIAERVDAAWENGDAPLPFEAIEILKPIFYRRKGAYLVGRARGGRRVMPVVIALQHAERGVFADAVLVREEEISNVFSYTRSYFQVDVDRPLDTIEFLRSLMPRKPVSELTSALGFDRHGKTELYRYLRRHLGQTHEQFEHAPGTRGVAMSVFAMAGFQVVFKVIRDNGVLKSGKTAADVRGRYELVAQHDRAGRLLDTQQFEHVVFSRLKFSEELLDDLLTKASQTVSVDGDNVLVEHLYTERRVKPLDLCLRDAEGRVRDYLLGEYAQAILDMAATGLVAYEPFFKNFGVTQHGRVVFYGYDDMTLLDKCSFHELPKTGSVQSDQEREGDNIDVYPEALDRYISLAPAERDRFRAVHPELFQPIYWQLMKDRYSSGEVVDSHPYRADRSLWDA